MLQRWFFLLFVLSGFCSLVYQIVWLRLSMSRFGVTTALISIVLAVFMSGLAAGSWAGGRLGRRLARAGVAAALLAYAACELFIALSARVVPAALAWGRHALFDETGTPWASATHHLVSGVWIAVVLVPFAFAMGATFPLAMAAIRVREGEPSGFGLLYMANVLGATIGTLAAAFVLIELLGFRGTLGLAAGINALVAALALLLAVQARREARSFAETPAAAPPAAAAASHAPLGLLFATGLISMAMEIVWVRQFGPVLGNLVYAFAIILAVYLLATFLGSALYRAQSARRAGHAPGAWVWCALAVAAMLPAVLADPRLPGSVRFEGSFAPLAGTVMVLAAIAPFCALLGWVTPRLVDAWSAQQPHRVGTAYAVNAVGCVLGPLLAGFVLLPVLPERVVLAVLCLALLLAGMAFGMRRRAPWAAAAAGGVIALAAVTRGDEVRFPDPQVRRDSTASVVAYGNARLVVNGVGMTRLTPITKMMSHLPLAWLDRPATRGLVVCFGMGTSFRSMHSWGIDTTAVELVPSVPEFFGAFHPGAGETLRASNAHVVIDDGRRFLDRSRDIFDVVTVDPPPPTEAAGSSLLYSREFYQSVRRRLAPDGIVQVWMPGSDNATMLAMLSAVAHEFPHLRIYGSVEGWGMHVLARGVPLPELNAAQLAARLPPAAARDLVEWGPHDTPEEMFAAVVASPTIVNRTALVGLPPLVDDWPINEYFLLRRWRAERAASP